MPVEQAPPRVKSAQAPREAHWSLALGLNEVVSSSLRKVLNLLERHTVGLCCTEESGCHDEVVVYSLVAEKAQREFDGPCTPPRQRSSDTLSTAPGTPASSYEESPPSSSESWRSLPGLPIWPFGGKPGAVHNAALTDALKHLGAADMAYQLDGQKFIDTSFPPVLSGRATKWVRPQEITAQAGEPVDGGWAWEIFGVSQSADWQLFNGAPRSEDVHQGVLGDCWLLSSLAALAEFQGGRFVRALLPEQEGVSPSGAYVVRLCLGGRWNGILVDDLLPAVGGDGEFCTQLVNCETHRLQLWASIVEKGFAKACGSYEALQAGEAREALMALTGWPCMMVDFTCPGFDAEHAWAKLLSNKKDGFLTTCGTHRTLTPSIQPFHIYALLDVLEVSGKASGHIVRLLKIRNPNGKSKWGGDWSNDSSRWTAELRVLAGCPLGGIPGVFFMEYDDFLRHFAHITTCPIRYHWHEERLPISLPSSGSPSVGVTFSVAETAECTVSLSQQEMRVRQGSLSGDLPDTLAAIGFVLLCFSPKGDIQKPVATAALLPRDSATVDCCLQPGMSYLIMPVGVHRSGSALPVTVACFSSRPVSFGQPKTHGAEACQMAQRALRVAEGRHQRTTGCESM